MLSANKSVFQPAKKIKIYQHGDEMVTYWCMSVKTTFISTGMIWVNRSSTPIDLVVLVIFFGGNDDLPLDRLGHSTFRHTCQR